MLTFLLSHLPTIIVAALLVITSIVSFLLGAKTTIEYIDETDKFAFYTTQKGEVGVMFQIKVLGKLLMFQRQTCSHVSKAIAKAVMDAPSTDEDGCHKP